MSNVIVDEQIFNRPVSFRTCKNGKIELFIPYRLIPNRVEGVYSLQKDNYEVNIVYGDKEPEKVIYEDENKIIEVGRNSNKLLRIIVKGLKRRGIDRSMLTDEIKSFISPKKFIKKNLDKRIEKESLDKNWAFIEDNVSLLTSDY